MKWEARLNLKKGGSPITVFIEANNCHEARRLLEAQYEIVNFATLPIQRG